MTLKFAKLAILATMVLGASYAQAAPLGHVAVGVGAQQESSGLVHQVAQRKLRKKRKMRRFKARSRRTARRGGRGVGGFKGKGGVVKDTCTSSHPFYGGDCSPEALTSRCDAAGGGMSSEEGGGVTCELR